MIGLLRFAEQMKITKFIHRTYAHDSFVCLFLVDVWTIFWAHNTGLCPTCPNPCFFLSVSSPYSSYSYRGALCCVCYALMLCLFSNCSTDINHGPSEGKHTTDYEISFNIFVFLGRDEIIGGWLQILTRIWWQHNKHNLNIVIARKIFFRKQQLY